MSRLPQGARTVPPATSSTKLSRLHKPQDMSLEAWQLELRRQYGRQQELRLKDTGTERDVQTGPDHL
jgi:hypothetical protein